MHTPARSTIHNLLLDPPPPKKKKHEQSASALGAHDPESRTATGTGLSEASSRLPGGRLQEAPGKEGRALSGRVGRAAAWSANRASFRFRCTVLGRHGRWEGSLDDARWGRHVRMPRRSLGSTSTCRVRNVPPSSTTKILTSLAKGDGSASTKHKYSCWYWYWYHTRSVPRWQREPSSSCCELALAGHGSSLITRC
ncbi:hypothetical protein BC628DRAFT_125965 [Trametes gibbosa]|nr:hypothetical protein BC628DRAFT_125965 [Trametes gibbosa]